ncbi:glycosyl hydrolase [Thalassotalea fonticola]|uniref:Glycosyl hydrolase n=1 Tax=Thalassotalea fonticola TaxID=3065649 RepID=A0ABZ0GKE2_9GAMM|nr:glycosyl hydrolase [Colwelliaceae bacterium S1-1]
MNIKTISSGLFAMTLFLTGCGGDGSKAEVESNEEEYSHQTPATKKGSAFSNKDLVWSNQTADLKPHWNYDWSLTKSASFQPDGIEFVAMQWGKWALSDEALAALAQAYADGDIKYILGFNEPDGEDQANLSVEESLPIWDQLVTVGAPMVSPATVDPLNDWMQEFMTARGNEVSYVAMHWYGGTDVGAFLAKVDEVYNAYGKPVWITEFAVADWTATTEEENQYSDQEVIDFMKAVLPALDENEHVFRYSWFSVNAAADNFHNLASSALFDARDMETGATTITALGEVYAVHTPNGYAGGGKTPPLVDLVPGNLIINGHFEDATLAPWEGYNRSGQIETAEIQATDGVKFGRINQNQDGSLLQFFNLEADKTYKLTYNARWHTGTAPMKAVVKKGGTKIFAEDINFVDGDWAATEHNFAASAGAGEYKVVFWHAGGTPPFFYLDEVVLLEVE